MDKKMNNTSKDKNIKVTCIFDKDREKLEEKLLKCFELYLKQNMR